MAFELGSGVQISKLASRVSSESAADWPANFEICTPDPRTRVLLFCRPRGRRGLTWADEMNPISPYPRESQVAVRVVTGMSCVLLWILVASVATTLGTVFACLVVAIPLGVLNFSLNGIGVILSNATPFGIVCSVPVSLAALISPSKFRRGVIAKGAIVSSAIAVLSMIYVLCILAYAE